MVAMTAAATVTAMATPATIPATWTEIWAPTRTLVVATEVEMVATAS